jgi:hypothetical protein
MLMTMLDAGGFPVSGPRPSYEPVDHWQAGRPNMDWLRAQNGRAVKWLDPSRHFTLPGRLSVKPIILLLERNPREQARSQVKLMSGYIPGPVKRAEKAMERSIRRDMPVVRAQLGGSATVHRLAFEDVLEDPAWAARKLERLVSFHFAAGFKTEAAARVVMERHPACLPDLRMEQFVLPLLAQRIEAANG